MRCNPSQRPEQCRIEDTLFPRAGRDLPERPLRRSLPHRGHIAPDLPASQRDAHDVSHVECRQRLGDFIRKSVVDGECRYVWYDLCDPGQVEGPSHVHISEIRPQRRSATSSFDMSCHGSVAPSGRMSVTWLVSVPKPDPGALTSFATNRSTPLRRALETASSSPPTSAANPTRNGRGLMAAMPRRMSGVASSSIVGGPSLRRSFP